MNTARRGLPALLSVSSLALLGGALSITACGGSDDAAASPPGSAGASAAGAGGATAGAGGATAGAGGASAGAGGATAGAGGATAGAGGATAGAGGASAGAGGASAGAAGQAALTGTPVIVAASAAGHDRFFGVTHDAAGNIYAVGSIADGVDATTDFAMFVAKFSPAGVLDQTFGTKGFAVKNVATGAGGEVARGIVVQSTGKIVIAGTVEHAGATDARDRDIALVRFDATGKIDATFGKAGVAILDLSDGEVVGTSYVADAQWGLARYADDRLLVSGSKKRAGATDSDFVTLRLDQDGALDATYASGGVYSLDIGQLGASARAVHLLPDETSVSCGYVADNGVTRPVIYKLDKSGKPDTSFGTAGLFNAPVLTTVSEVYAVAPQGTSLVTAGYGHEDATTANDWLSFRVTAAGQHDTTYGTSGRTTVDVAGFSDQARSVTVLPDGRILVVGGGRPTTANVDAMIGVLGADGLVDPALGPQGFKLHDLGGASDVFWGVSVAPDKKSVVVVGSKGVGAEAGNDDAAILVLSL